MSINISYLAGAGAQFFDSNGDPLSGGLLYTYAAGTTTPASTYTSSSGAFFNANPIVLDAAGRTPNEIWLTGGTLYKFVLKDSTFVQIGSYDDIPAVNDPTTTNNLITVTGTNTLTGLAIPSLEGYTAGAQYTFVAQNTNSAAATLNIDGLGAKTVTKFGNIPLSGGELIAGSIGIVEYDGTKFQLINPNPNAIPSIKTGNFTAVTFNTYAVNTTAGAVTATLPASPIAGDSITFIDYARTFALNNLTIAPNGNKINAGTNNLALNISGEAVSLVYVDATQGWLCYSGFASNPTINYSASYLVVSGGGGGGWAIAEGGGGGAGGLLTGSTTLSAGTAYTITVGSGGAATTGSGLAGSSGNASSISTVISSIGGGGGGSSGAVAGVAGGSGGGGSDNGTTSVPPGAGTTGQGFAGGLGTGGGGGGGGGGAGAVGLLKNGGVGLSNSISGSAVFYAGGGAGGNSGTGGTGGGGGVGANGTANTGGGGGAYTGSGGNGGSGIVIISYVGTQRGTGGTVTTSGGNTIHTFTSSGTYNA